MCLFQHLLDSIHLSHRLLFLSCLDLFSQALLHTPLMCSRFHWVFLLGCSQILVQIMYLFLKFSYLFHMDLFPLLGTVYPFHLRMMFSMCLGVWDVFSVFHSWAVLLFHVLILSLPYELANVWGVPLSGKVLYIFSQKFFIWSFVKLVQTSFG